MILLQDKLIANWGSVDRAKAVADLYQQVFKSPMFLMLREDLAFYCGVSAENDGATEFERGVAEGKRRVMLHIEQVSRLQPDDFPAPPEESDE